MTIKEFHEEVQRDISDIEEIDAVNYKREIESMTDYNHLAYMVEQVGEVANCFTTPTGEPTDSVLYDQLVTLSGIIAEWAIQVKKENI